MNREFLSEVHRLEEGLEGQKFENEQLRQAVEERERGGERGPKMNSLSIRYYYRW